MADTDLHRIKRPVGRHTGHAPVSPVGSGAWECMKVSERTHQQMLTLAGHSRQLGFLFYKRSLVGVDHQYGILMRRDGNGY